MSQDVPSLLLLSELSELLKMQFTRLDGAGVTLVVLFPPFLPPLPPLPPCPPPPLPLLLFLLLPLPPLPTPTCHTLPKPFQEPVARYKPFTWYEDGEQKPKPIFWQHVHMLRIKWKIIFVHS